MWGEKYYFSFLVPDNIFVGRSRYLYDLVSNSLIQSFSDYYDYEYYDDVPAKRSAEPEPRRGGRNRFGNGYRGRGKRSPQPEPRRRRHRNRRRG